MTKLTPSNKAWLKKEIVSWSDEGLISEYQVESLFGKYNIPYKQKKGEKGSFNVVKVLAILGALLVGFGAILFVAANWEGMSRLAQTILLISATGATLAAGHLLSQSETKKAIGSSLLLISSLFFGGTIFLIAQMYHVNANAAWLVFVWAAGVLPLAYFLQSKPNWYLTTLLFVLWDALLFAETQRANYLYPLLMFFVLFPLTKSERVLSCINLLGLVLAQFYAVFSEQHWVALLWAVLSLVGGWKHGNRILLGISSFIFIEWSIIVNEPIPWASAFYLIPAALFMFWAYQKKQIPEVCLGIFGVWIWINVMLSTINDLWFNIPVEWIHAVLLQLGIGMVVLGLGLVQRQIKRVADLSYPYTIVGMVSTILITYLLSFQEVLEDATRDVQASFPSSSLAFLILGMGLVLFSYLKKSTELEARYGFLRAALVCIPALALIFASHQVILLLFLFNIALFCIALIDIWYGFETKDMILFHAGIVLFVVMIISRYFDLLWSFLDTSVFFIGGGIVLIAGSWYLEKKRRKAIAEMKKK